MNIYSNLFDEFMILDYLASHNQLLIRSKKTKGREYNIDIIFKGVLLLLLPSKLKGIEISLIKLGEINKNLTDAYNFKEDENYKLFSLTDNEGKRYFVNAMSFGIYQNSLDILETSILRYDMENHNENILWF